jgi:ParB/RepB/Spo0J family partition protein
MPETRQIELSMIDPPDIAARASMDDKKLAELAESMATTGQIQPLAVWERDGRYVIEDGHRRFTAACGLGWVTIRCEVWESATLAKGAVMVAANRFREDVTAAEEALLFAEHQERDSLDEEGLCKRFNVSTDYLGDRFRLLRGDKKVFEAVLGRRIKFAVARELNKCEDEAHRRYLLDLAINCGYPGRVVADMVRQWRKERAPTPALDNSAETPQPPAPAPPYKVECVICGGHRDPWNLVSVMIHQAELDAIMKSLERAAKDAAV